MRKVIILTLKLGSNYGGLLQAYALQRTIKSLGLNAATAHLYAPENRFKALVKRAIKPTYSLLTNRTKVSKSNYEKNTVKFIAKHIDTVDLFKNGARPQENIKNYNAVVVGSDQVWRAKYVDVPSYMLDLTEGMPVKKISYAASFGSDSVSEYSPELIKTTAGLASNFDAISVREDSGVKIANKYWGVTAEHHVDPVFLLDRAAISELIDNGPDTTKPIDGSLFTYVLDLDESKSEIVKRVSSLLSLAPFNLMPPKPKSRNELSDDPEIYNLPPVEQWLKSFRDAEFVVTDSFHGCALSIIFNKPFIAIGNKNRGLARFTSVLKTFDLDNRLILSSEGLTNEIIKEEIDWSKINQKIKDEQQKSFTYLKKHLRPDSE